MTFTTVLKTSPNQSERTHGDAAVRLIVCHTPEGPYKSMVSYMTDPNQSRKVSYHCLIREDGQEVTQLVPFFKKAWHAGAMNSLSDGISAAGYASKFNVYSEQARTMATIVAQRLVARNLKPNWTTDTAVGGFCRHADLQTDRSDPMSHVSWAIFVLMVKSEYKRIQSPSPDDTKRIAAIQEWVKARRDEGWDWEKIKDSANFREYLRRGGS